MASDSKVRTSLFHPYRHGKDISSEAAVGFDDSSAFIHGRHLLLRSVRYRRELIGDRHDLIDDPLQIPARLD